jgi:serine/threonine-protein kinase
MSDDPRVEQLLDQLLDPHVTPEEVCASCPELLPVVRNRWQQMRRLGADLDALFPPSGEPPPRPLDETALPRIPGYEAEAVLGRGGMGIVFRARHLRLDRLVALKMMLAGAYAEPRERGRFQREAEAVARLRHPNVVRIYDVGDVDGRSFFTMELVDGGSLAQQLAGTPQPARPAARLAATLAGAVHAAHACGVVHRDLKPGNVLLDADGTPKITDFGLARRLDGETGLTRSGDAVGTPSYMAPEQARGNAAAAGPAADVYALGAILYECLTGRPPFRGETAAETVYQVIYQDPVPPARLNGKVPRDLETICLKCLHKQPHRRYASAQELADDLHRFLDGKPVRARPVGVFERAGRWVKRHPRETVLAGLALLLFLVGAAWAWWSDRQAVARRAERQQQEERTRRGAEGALGQARLLCRQEHWPEALKALEQAELLVGSDGPEGLRQHVAVARRDLRMAEELDRIRQVKETIFETSLHEEPIPPAYVKAFRDYGLDVPDADLADLTRRVGDSEIKQQLIVALDHWAFLEPDAAIQERLTAIARAVDPDPWRNRVRNPAAWKDRAALVELAATAPVTEQPAQLLITLGSRLPVAGVKTLSPPVFAANLVTAPSSTAWVGNLLAPSALAPPTPDAVAFLERVQQEHPDDFWANFALANALNSRRPSESVAYYQAALALRPQVVAVHNNLWLALRALGRAHQAIDLLERALRIAPRDPTLRNNLGIALVTAGRPDEAAQHFRLALADFPNTPVLHNNLGIALKAGGQIDAAIEEYREAIRLKADDPQFHSNLAQAQLSKGRLDEATKHFREVVRLLPASGWARVDLGFALQRNGQVNDAIEQYRLAVQFDPSNPKAHANLGNALLVQGRAEEALGPVKQALRLDPQLAPAHYCLGRISKGNGRLDEAVTSFNQAVQLDPDFALAHFDLANTLKDLGRFDEAIVHYQETFRIDPTHANSQGALAQALVAAGRFREAREAALRCQGLLPEGNSLRVPVQRIVEQCEALLAVEARLPAILQGKDRAANAAETVQFADVCRIKKKPVVAVRFYAEALAAAPALFEDPRTARRYLAARAAALAGCGAGEEGGELSEDERARWRKEARAWLRADLAAWNRMIERDPGTIRPLLQRTLPQWQADPDLAGLRDPGELDRLSASEREECRAVWDEVRALWRRARPAGPE